MDEDIHWTDFPLRNYDAQIGRWVQQDPYQQFASPYVGMGNDPVNLVDPSGGFSWPPSGFLHLKTVAAGCSGAIRKALQISGQNVSALSLLSKVSIAIKTASTAEGIINSNVNSIQVGRQIAGANSESTCMGCESASARAKIQNYEASIALHSVPQLNPASLNAEEKTASLKREMMMEQMSVNELARFKGEDAILDRIHKGTVAEVEGSHSGSFPIIGNFLKAGNYSLKGESFSAEAGDAFKKGVIESAATYGVGKLFRLGMREVGSLKIPIYRVYGGGASMYGKSYSLINPKYVPFYRNFAGLPNVNSGQYLLKGSIPLRDIKVGRWFAAPLDGNTGGLPFEFYQNYNQLINPVNLIIKKIF